MTRCHITIQFIKCIFTSIIRYRFIVQCTCAYSARSNCSEDSTEKHIHTVSQLSLLASQPTNQPATHSILLSTHNITFTFLIVPVVNSREHHHLANGTIFGTSVLCVHSLFSREICGVLLFLFFFHIYFHYFFFFCFFWFNVIRWFVQFSSFLLLENYRQEANVRIFLTFHCTYKWQWTCYIFFYFSFYFSFLFHCKYWFEIDSHREVGKKSPSI